MTSGDSHAGLTRQVIGAAIDVHRALGPGLLESAYEACLAHELHERGISFERQVELPVQYKECRVECGFRADFIVDDRVVLELKATERLLPIHEAQRLTYLRLTGKRVGLLINFHSLILKDGIRRRML